MMQWPDAFLWTLLGISIAIGCRWLLEQLLKRRRPR